jgi:phosphatidylinositol-3-phosphatase
MLGLALAVLAGASSPVAPHASQVTIVLMENKDYDAMAGNPGAPYFNRQLVQQGILLQNSHAVTHPSEPNYLALFSGSTQGVRSDSCPVSFSAKNVASELIAAGKSFAGYSESMPRDGYMGCYHAGQYARKHSPWVDFTNVPAASNRVYHGFPPDPATLVWITPNVCHDMHDCNVSIGDAWLSKNLPPIIAWDRAHDGLLIVTWDEAEPDRGTNRIPTVLVGPMIRAGAADRQTVDHYSVLRTIETVLGVPCIENECRTPAITGIWE